MTVEREAFVSDRLGTDTTDDALARRCDQYLDRALGLAFYLLGDSHDAEDATQEAMALAWRARRSLRRPEAFDSWMDRILVNACREKLRRRGRVREVDLASRPELEDRFVVADRSDSLIARDFVGRALARLTFDQRTVLVLRYWRDMSLEQIADHLGWPLGTVKSRLHHALAALKSSLEQDEIEVSR